MNKLPIEETLGIKLFPGQRQAIVSIQWLCFSDLRDSCRDTTLAVAAIDQAMRNPGTWVGMTDFGYKWGMFDEAVRLIDDVEALRGKFMLKTTPSGWFIRYASGALK